VPSRRIAPKGYAVRTGADFEGANHGRGRGIERRNGAVHDVRQGFQVAAFAPSAPFCGNEASSPNAIAGPALPGGRHHEMLLLHHLLHRVHALPHHLHRSSRENGLAPAADGGRMSGASEAGRRWFVSA